MSVAPILPAAAALRVEILGAAEAELIAMLGAAPELEAAPSPAPSAGAPSPAPKAQALDTARAAAAGRQGSLAPLFADLTQALSAPGLPAAIKTAIGLVLALQLPADGSVDPQAVRQAVARSGLFLEADLASVRPGDPAPVDLKAALLTLQRALPAAAPPTEAPPPALQASPTEPPEPASPPQGAAPEGAAPQIAGPQIAGPQIAGPQGAPPQSAAPQSAGPPAPAPATAPASPGPAVLQPQPPQIEPAASSPQSAEPAAAPATPAPSGAVPPAAGEPPKPQLPAGGLVPPQEVRQAVAASARFVQADTATIAPQAPAPRDPRAALLALQQAAPSAPPDAPAPTPRTAPPARDAALSPQAPAPATLPRGADLSAILQHLRPEVEQALARVTLHQLASLPDGAAQAWMFELPVATPQGTAIAQFEVDRDGAGSGAADGVAPWRARFSIDVEPLGPVHVHVAMTGGKAAVSVWAERADSLARLRDHGAELARALPAEVVFRPGAPGGAVPARGHFLDQTS